MITVSIYEDNDQLRTSLELLIASQDDLTVVGAYGHGQAIVEQVAQDRPNVVLLDIDMPGRDGIACVQLVKELNPVIGILMHTVFEDDDRLFACLRNGANGYLLKKDTATHLLPALHEVMDGGGPMSPGIARRVLQTFKRPATPIESPYGISPREQELLQLLTKGYTYRMIGLDLQISVETVRRHLKNIYQKLHVQCGTEAVAKALKEQII